MIAQRTAREREAARWEAIVRGHPDDPQARAQAQLADARRRLAQVRAR